MKHLRIFISGCSGVGKTTLCKAFSELTGIPYVNASASNVWDNFGIKSHSDALLLDPTQAYRYQEMVHNYRMNQLRQVDGPVITDRGVMDHLIYLADYNLNPRDRDILVKDIMVDFFQDLENYNCVFIKVLKPFDWKTEDNGKRITDEFYQTMSNMKYAGFDFRMFMPKDKLGHYYQISEVGSPVVYLKKMGIDKRADIPKIYVGGMYTSVLNKRMLGILQIMVNSGNLNNEDFVKLYDELNQKQYDPKKYI